MNWHLYRINVEWISVISLSVIPMIDLLGELSHIMKNGSITATLTPRNSGSVLINLPKSLLEKVGSASMLYVCWKFEGVVQWEFVRTGVLSIRIFILNNWNEIMKFWEGYTQHWLNEMEFSFSRIMVPYCMNHNKNLATGRNRTDTTSSI